MGILSRYLCKEFIKLFVVCQTLFVLLYVVIDFLQKIDNFLEAHTSQGIMLLFFVYKIPLIIVQMTPAAALISVTIMFSFMKRYNEIIALKSSGISVFRMSLPILMTAMGLSILVFIFSESVVPYASTKSNDLWDTKVKKHGQKRFYNRSNIWFKGEAGIYWIKHYDGNRMVMLDAVFYFMDHSFQLCQRIDAGKVWWTGKEWKAGQGIALQRGQNGDYRFKRFSEMIIQIPETPDAFLRTEKEPEEMSYWELKRYSEKTGMQGYDKTRYIVDLNAKPAFSMLSFIMVLVGIPIALKVNKGGAPLAVSIGIGISFVYILIHGVSQSLGYSGTLPPVFSAWLASALFFLLGIYLMMRMDT